MTAQEKECTALLKIIDKKYDEYTETEKIYTKLLSDHNAKVEELNEITSSIMVTPDFFLTEYATLKQEEKQITDMKTTLNTKRGEISQLIMKSVEMKCKLPKEMKKNE